MKTIDEIKLQNNKGEGSFKNVKKSNLSKIRQIIRDVYYGDDSINRKNSFKTDLINSVKDIIRDDDYLALNKIDFIKEGSSIVSVVDKHQNNYFKFYVVVLGALDYKIDFCKYWIDFHESCGNFEIDDERREYNKIMTLRNDIAHHLLDFNLSLSSELREVILNCDGFKSLGLLYSNISFYVMETEVLNYVNAYNKGYLEGKCIDVKEIQKLYNSLDYEVMDNRRINNEKIDKVKVKYRK